MDAWDLTNPIFSLMIGKTRAPPIKAQQHSSRVQIIQIIQMPVNCFVVGSTSYGLGPLLLCLFVGLLKLRSSLSPRLMLDSDFDDFQALCGSVGLEGLCKSKSTSIFPIPLRKRIKRTRSQISA